MVPFMVDSTSLPIATFPLRVNWVLPFELVTSSPASVHCFQALIYRLSSSVRSAAFLAFDVVARDFNVLKNTPSDPASADWFFFMPHWKMPRLAVSSPLPEVLPKLPSITLTMDTIFRTSAKSDCLSAGSLPASALMSCSLLVYSDFGWVGATHSSGPPGLVINTQTPPAA